MTISFGPAGYLTAALAFLLGIWGVAAVVLNGDEITDNEIEQRARLLALTANIGAQAKENFQALIKDRDTGTQDKGPAAGGDRLQSRQIARRTELDLQERQKQFGMALQKQAVASARAALLPKLRKHAREELMDERVKLRRARKIGIEVSDDEVKALVADLGGRNKMTYEQSAQHLNGMGVDIATLLEKFRAQTAWRKLIERH